MPPIIPPTNCVVAFTAPLFVQFSTVPAVIIRPTIEPVYVVIVLLFVEVALILSLLVRFFITPSVVMTPNKPAP